MRHLIPAPRIIVPILTALASLAIFVSPVSAFIWSVAGRGAIETGESEALTLTQKKESVTRLTGTVSGVPVEITATGLEGVGTKLEGGGVLSGQMKLTGLKLVKPTTCSVPTSLTTAAIKGEPTQSGSVLYDKIVPVSGTTLATLTPTGECALAGTPFKLTGNLFAKLEPVETRLPEQPFEFSPTIEAAAGGKLEMGGNTANLTMAGRGSVEGLRDIWAALFGPYYQMSPAYTGVQGAQTKAHSFTFNKTELKCTEATFVSPLAKAASTLPLEPTYETCSAFGLKNKVAFQREACTLTALHPVSVGAKYVAEVQVVCPAKASMKFEVKNEGKAGNLCEVLIGSQKAGGKIEFSPVAGPPESFKVTVPLTLNYTVNTNEPKECAGGNFQGNYTGEFELADGGKKNNFFIK